MKRVTPEYTCQTLLHTNLLTYCQSIRIYKVKLVSKRTGQYSESHVNLHEVLWRRVWLPFTLHRITRFLSLSIQRSSLKSQDSFKAAPSSEELVDLRCSLKSRALGYSTSSKASRWSYTAAHECIRLCSRTWCAVVQPLAMQLLD